MYTTMPSISPSQKSIEVNGVSIKQLAITLPVEGVYNYYTLLLTFSLCCIWYSLSDQSTYIIYNHGLLKLLNNNR